MLYPFVEEQIKDGAMYYILLDEVQLLAEFESVLNGLARMKNVDLYVTGSNARFLSKDIITEFRGRGDEIHMSSLSFSEFMSAYEGSRQEGWNEYMVYGGLPIISSFHTPEQKADFLKALFVFESYSFLRAVPYPCGLLPAARRKGTVACRRGYVV